MTTAVTPHTNNNTHSSRQLPPPLTTDIPNSPTLRRGMRPSYPWSQVVRGESEPIVVVAAPPPVLQSPVVTVVESNVAAPLSVSPPPLRESEGSDYNGNAGKKPVWNKPSNGDSSDTGPGAVMEGVTWPALSEAAKAAKAASSKSSADSLKAVSDGSSSASLLQLPGTATSSVARQTSKSTNSNSAPSNAATGRQRSMKRDTASFSPANFSPNGALLYTGTPQGPTSETQFSNHSPKDHGQRSSSMQRNHNNNDHQPHRNSFKNRNGGQHPRGDNSHHQNYGGRRNHDHANQDWNPHRNLNGRDAHIQHQRGVPRFPRPTAPAPFVAQPTLRPYGVSMGFPELPPPLYYVAAPPPDPLRVPYYTPIPPPMYYSAPDPNLPAKILFQIEYYFSNANLVKDIYLRENMDEQGWVPINLIAGFNKVLALTNNIELILDSIRSSSLVEVQGDKIRRSNDWMRWIMPRRMSIIPNGSSPWSSGTPELDNLAGRIHNISLEGSTSYSGAKDNEESSRPYSTD